MYLWMCVCMYVYVCVFSIWLTVNLTLTLSQMQMRSIVLRFLRFFYDLSLSLKFDNDDEAMYVWLMMYNRKRFKNYE